MGHTATKLPKGSVGWRCWLLPAVRHSPDQALQKPPRCRSPGPGKLCTELRESTPGLGKKTPFSSVSLQYPLVAESNAVPAGRGETLQGPGSIFTEQEVKDE